MKKFNSYTDLNRNGTTSEVVSIGIFDDTADASLTLYSCLCDSASSFQPSHTVLLISNPGWRIDRSAKLYLNANSRLDIDPDLGDAFRLRAVARRLNKKEHVNPPFPDIDTSAFANAPVRPLYNLADVDTFARSNPNQDVIGYLSVLITAINIVTPYKRNMLMSNECCGIPIFANATVAMCKQCTSPVALRINPRIVCCSLPPSPPFLLFPFFPQFCPTRQMQNFKNSIIKLTNTPPARPPPRRNRPNRQRQSHFIGYRMGAITRQDGGATRYYGAGSPRVSGAEACVAAC